MSKAKRKRRCAGCERLLPPHRTKYNRHTRSYYCKNGDACELSTRGYVPFAIGVNSYKCVLWFPVREFQPKCWPPDLIFARRYDTERNATKALRYAQKHHPEATVRRVYP